MSGRFNLDTISLNDKADITVVNNNFQRIETFGVTYEEAKARATTVLDGVMSKEDKAKLDGIANGATRVTKTSDISNDSGYLTEHQDISGKEDKSNKVTSISSSSTNTQYPSAKLLYDQLELKEDTSNKVAEISPSSTNTQYPGAKLLYDQLELKLDVDKKASTQEAQTGTDNTKYMTPLTVLKSIQNIMETPASQYIEYNVPNDNTFRDYTFEFNITKSYRYAIIISGENRVMAGSNLGTSFVLYDLLENIALVNLGNYSTNDYLDIYKSAIFHFVTTGVDTTKSVTKSNDKLTIVVETRTNENNQKATMRFIPLGGLII